MSDKAVMESSFILTDRDYHPHIIEFFNDECGSNGSRTFSNRINYKGRLVFENEDREPILENFPFHRCIQSIVMGGHNENSYHPQSFIPFFNKCTDLRGVVDNAVAHRVGKKVTIDLEGTIVLPSGSPFSLLSFEDRNGRERLYIMMRINFDTLFTGQYYEGSLGKLPCTRSNFSLEIRRVGSTMPPCFLDGHIRKSNRIKCCGIGKLFIKTTDAAPLDELQISVENGTSSIYHLGEKGENYREIEKCDHNSMVVVDVSHYKSSVIKVSSLRREIEISSSLTHE